MTCWRRCGGGPTPRPGRGSVAGVSEGTHDVEPADEHPDLQVEIPGTGDPGVDAAIDRVAAASQADLEDQAAAYEAAHRLLTDRLADVEG